MTSNDLARRSPEELMAFIIARFEHAGYMLEETQPVPGGQLLRFRQKSMKYVAYGVSNTSLFDPLLDVTSVEVAENLMAASGYIIHTQPFSFAAQRRDLDTSVWTCAA